MKRFVTATLVVSAWTTAYAQDVPPFRLIDGQAFNTAVVETARANREGPLEEDAGNTGGQDATPPPTPAHTGFAALAHETWNDFKAFPQRQSTWVILGVGGAAA